MKRFLHIVVLLPVLFFVCQDTKAQVSVVLFTSPAKQFFIDDLWKSTLINTSTSSINVYVQFQIRDNATSDVLTLTTQVITLTAGANHLNSSEGISGKWVYGNSEASTILHSTGKLPYGHYTYGILVYSAYTSKPLGSNNDEIDVQPMLPPELASPRNEDTISIKYPVLSWIPPRPIIGLSIIYSLRLVALQANQSPSEGLLEDAPLLNLENLSSTYTTYPASAQELQAGTTYAWQVGASYEGYSLGVTDVWVFTPKPPEPPPTDPMIYPVATKVSDAHFYVTHGIFRFAYKNMAGDKTLSYTITRMDNRAKVKNLPVAQVQAGMNELNIDLKKNLDLVTGKYYILEIKDKKGHTYKLTFIYSA